MERSINPFLNRISLIAFSLSLFFISCNSDSDKALPTMELDPGSPREVAFTDKGDAFWVTRAGGYNSSPWHGLSASKRGYFEDFYLSANGQLLPRESAQVSVSPHQLIREYTELGIREVWTLLDKERTLIVQLIADEATHWTVQPAILGGNKSQDFDIETSDHELNVFMRQLADAPASYPYMKIWFSHPMNWLPAEAPDVYTYSAFLTQRADYEASHKLTMVVSLSDREEDTEHEPGWIERAKSERENRLIDLLSATSFSSNQKQLDLAIAWAHTALDALVMDQRGKGIYAGLPWFDDYWGRDAFISFSGAVLVNGQFEEAKQILLAFAQLQNKDPNDKNYGRVPNRAQPDDIIYNTTDGTPWFIRSVWDYYRYSGDEDFLQQMWPAIQISTKGAIKNWADDFGVMRHDDADTWMDAKTLEGAWSPRGDRAIEIQFIWRDQLEITKRLAKKFGDEELASSSAETLIKLNRSLDNFRVGENQHYVDHLNSDDSKDEMIRPNVFLVPPLFQETCDWTTFKAWAPQLITKNGVLSLSQDDTNFHPYHHLQGQYVQDAAYHNGIIWTWNSAATITQAIRFHQYHYAQALFDDLTRLILNRGAVGTMAELTDAWPRDNQLRLSGTFSQAWSLAEYLRTFYQDILGVQPDLTKSKVSLAPRLLEDMDHVEFNAPIGNDSWELEYDESEKHFDITINRNETKDIHLFIELLHETTLGKLELDWKTKRIHLRYEKFMGQWTVPSDIPDYSVKNESVDIPINSLDFCKVDTRIEVPALQGASHRLLRPEEVIAGETQGNMILKAQDPKGDDRGDTGDYVYPAHPQFEAGIADIIGFQLDETSQGYSFKMEFTNLSDPGWHPEYGYQLTYCAIGISYDPLTGTRQLKKNAKTRFKSNFKADQLIYVSGGVSITDTDNKTIAEYLPPSSGGAIGSAISETIQFMLPKELFDGDLSQASFQIAVGCQDDHGGAVIGDFREVQEKVSEWAGGGKSGTQTSNVYDWLIP